MLTFNGTVTETNGNNAIVLVDCGGNCDKCGACSQASKKTIKAINEIGANVNDNVEIVFYNFKHKIVSCLCYSMPVFVTLVLVLSLMNFVSTLILSLSALICFIFLCCCGIIISNWMSKNMQIKIIKINRGE